MKWEYKVEQIKVDAQNPLTDQLNYFGEHGWEVVHMQPRNSSILSTCKQRPYRVTTNIKNTFDVVLKRPLKG